MVTQILSILLGTLYILSAVTGTSGSSTIVHSLSRRLINQLPGVKASEAQLCQMEGYRGLRSLGNTV